jgi:hypothetical protein
MTAGNSDRSSTFVFRRNILIWLSLKFFDDSGSFQRINYIKGHCKFPEIGNDVSHNFGRTEDKCEMRNFTICTSYQILFG